MKAKSYHKSLMLQELFEELFDQVHKEMSFYIWYSENVLLVIVSLLNELVFMFVSFYFTM